MAREGCRRAAASSSITVQWRGALSSVNHGIGAIRRIPAAHTSGTSEGAQDRALHVHRLTEQPRAVGPPKGTKCSTAQARPRRSISVVAGMDLQNATRRSLRTASIWSARHLTKLRIPDSAAGIPIGRGTRPCCRAPSARVRHVHQQLSVGSLQLPRGEEAPGQRVLPRADRIRYEEVATDLLQHYKTTGSRDLVELNGRARYSPWSAASSISGQVR